MPSIDNTDIPLTGDEALSSRWWNDEQDLLTNIEESIEMQEHDYWQERRTISALNQLVQSIRLDIKSGYTATRWDEQVCITYYPAGPDSRIRYYVKSHEEWLALKNKLNY